ncbi:hypothetical protein Q0590_26040 [Rhodocytophaga aerolata]|uniref:Uncharacterized protein n=1 Tax=Rhodocytophaga aerolata TaxID=455078 RepID=A0ABT8RCD3_9BACT|nr:hypothetical protein [Rhodocytophaga aerolata]MDO1449766.1 hypothetical protein [Rhodocytophaga aerolata]
MAISIKKGRDINKALYVSSFAIKLTTYRYCYANYLEGVHTFYLIDPIAFVFRV